MATWPLPHRPRLDLEIDPQETRLRTKTAQGPPKMRRRFTAGTREWSFTLLLTGAEKTTLESWYTTTLVSGTLAFDWLDESNVARSFRFVERLQVKPEVGHHIPEKRLWLVRFVLEVLP